MFGDWLGTWQGVWFGQVAPTVTQCDEWSGQWHGVWFGRWWCIAFVPPVLPVEIQSGGWSEWPLTRWQPEMIANEDDEAIMTSLLLAIEELM